jgi:hypothetical protein
MRFLKGCVTLVLLSLSIIAVFLPAAVFVHEATHSLLYTLEGIPVTSFHVLDAESITTDRFGFVTTTVESRYGSVFHETVATMITSLFITILLLLFLLIILKKFTVHQLESMGIHPSPHKDLTTPEH